jgi:WhiB family redox-sensing transcriptional regulator
MQLLDLLGMLITGDWVDEAACRGTGEHDLWFPVSETGPALDEVAQAKAVCGGCPVRAECLDSALSRGIDYGVWGGLTPDERRALRRRRREKACSQVA